VDIEQAKQTLAEIIHRCDMLRGELCGEQLKPDSVWQDWDVVQDLPTGYILIRLPSNRTPGNLQGYPWACLEDRVLRMSDSDVNSAIIRCLPNLKDIIAGLVGGKGEQKNP